MSSPLQGRKLDPNARAFVPATDGSEQQQQQQQQHRHKKNKQQQVADVRRRADRKQDAPARTQTRKQKAAGQPGNHLISFQYEHQPQRQKQKPRGGRQRPPAAHKPRASKPISQEQFLQANFAFVVNPYADPWQAGFYDPDELIGWRDIERVSFPTPAHSPYQCPVCLDTPSVPKITQCGHCFCFTCILRHLDGEITRRCPMCMRNIRRNELRSLIFTHTCTPLVGEPFEFRLLHCVRGTISPFLPNQDRLRTTAQLALHDALTAGVPAPVHDDGSPYTAFDVLPTNEDPAARYCRVVVASPETVMEYIYMERAQLEGLREQSYKSLEDTERLPYIVEALHLLDEKMRQWAAYVSSHKLHLPEKAKTPQPEIFSPPSITAVEGDAWHEFGEEDDGNDAKLSAEDCETAGNEQTQDGTRARSSTSTSDSSHSGLQHRQEAYSEELGFTTFFQAENGDLIFLHPFNTTCILTEFEGDTSRFPQRLVGKVVEVETVRVNDETRKMYRFLSHLPEHCEVMLVEIDLQKVVSKKTLEHFKSEMKRRANRRKALARKAAMTAQADADAQEAIKLQQHDLKEHFAAVKRRESEQLVQLLHGPRVGKTAQDNAVEEQEGRDSGDYNQPPVAGWSFSRIIQVGGHFPTLAELSGAESTHLDVQVGSPSRASGAWVRPQPPPAPTVPQTTRQDAAAATEATAIGTASNPTSSDGKKGGKKKSKSQPLFSSGGVRSYK